MGIRRRSIEGHQRLRRLVVLGGEDSRRRTTEGTIADTVVGIKDRIREMAETVGSKVREADREAEAEDRTPEDGEIEVEGEEAQDEEEQHRFTQFRLLNREDSVTTIMIQT